MKNPDSFDFFTLTWSGRKSNQCRVPQASIWWETSTFIQWFISDSVVIIFELTFCVIRKKMCGFVKTHGLAFSLRGCYFKGLALASWHCVTWGCGWYLIHESLLQHVQWLNASSAGNLCNKCPFVSGADNFIYPDFNNFRNNNCLKINKSWEILLVT